MYDRKLKMKELLRVFPAVLFVLALAAALWGCADTGGGDDAVDPPTGLSYPSFYINAVAGVPVPALAPVLSGGTASYSISPALPGGLTLDAKTGVVSGTPAAATDPVLHTITAANSAGSSTFQFYSKVYAAAGATITGTVTLPAPVTNRFYSVTVDTDHDGGNGGQVGWDIGKVTGSSFTYSVKNVPAGSYMVYVIVYAVSGDSLDTLNEPGIGEFVSGDHTIISVSGTGSYTADRTCAVKTSATVFLDTFDRTTGLGSDWTASNYVSSPVSIVSDKLSIVQAGTDTPYALYNTALTDQRLRVMFKVDFTAVHELEILFRFDSTANTGYYAGIGFDNLTIGKFTGPGSPTQIAGASPAYTISSMTGNTYNFDLQIDGSTFTLYLMNEAGTTALSSVSVTDSTYSSGKIGLVSGVSVNGSSTIDNFKIVKYQ